MSEWTDRQDFPSDPSSPARGPLFRPRRWRTAATSLLGAVLLLGPADAFPQDRVPATPLPNAIDQYQPTQRDGTSVRVHLAGAPAGLNYLLHGQDTNCLIVWEEVMDRLAFYDWEKTELQPRLATHWVIEDVAVLEKDPAPLTGEGDNAPSDQELHAWDQSMHGEAFLSRRSIGRVDDLGEARRIVPVSQRRSVEELEPRVLPSADIVRVDRGCSYTIHLRRGVRWHDGAPFNAHDVRFSWEAVKNRFVDCGWIRSYFDQIRACEVLDDYTVRMVFDRQYYQAQFYALVAFYLLPRHKLEVTSFTNPADPVACAKEQAARINLYRGIPNPSEPGLAGEALVGLGPYRLAEWDPDHHIDLVRFDGYWGRRPSIETIRYRLIADGQTAYRALKADQLDFLPRAPVHEFFEDAPTDPHIGEHYIRALYNTPQVALIAWNLHSPVFKDRAVRHALVHAIDREKVVKMATDGVGTLVTGDQFSGGPAYDRNLAPFPYDPERAERLLDEAGWYDRDEDGIRDKDGVPLSFSLIIPSSSAVSRVLSREMQNAYRPVGIDMKVDAVERATFITRMQAGDFDACPFVWSMDPETDPYPSWHSSLAPQGSGGSNVAGFALPEADRLIEAGRRELDDRKRFSIWHELQAVIQQEQPALFLYSKPERAIYHRKYRGVRFNADRPGYSLRDWVIVEPASSSSG